MAKLLDNENSKELRISNDAFFFLLDGEDMLFDESEQEVETIKAQFPLGFKISEWDYDGGGDIIATFIPYKLDPNTAYNLGDKFSNELFIEVAYYNGDSTCDIRFISAKDGYLIKKPYEPRTISVQRNKHGLLYFCPWEPDHYSGMQTTFFINKLIPIAELDKLKLPKFGWK